MPKVGWLRLADSDLYAGCRPLTVRIRLEGTEPHPKWYAYVCCEVPAEQATDSDGTVYAMPDADKLDAQIAYKQRELNRKQDWGPKDRGKRRSNRGRRVNGQLNKLHRKRDDATNSITELNSKNLNFPLRYQAQRKSWCCRLGRCWVPEGPWFQCPEASDPLQACQNNTFHEVPLTEQKEDQGWNRYRGRRSHQQFPIG